MTRGALVRGVALLVGPVIAAAPSSGCGAVETIEGVSYDARYGEATTMDVYLPPGGGGGGPAILAVHGGSWKFGSSKHYRGICKRFARSGWPCASINYRLLPEGRFPEAVKDVKCALVFFRSMAAAWGFDPERVAITGYSAGAHLAALVATSEEVPELDADCGAVGSGEPARAGAAFPADGVYDASINRGRIDDFFGGSIEEIPEAYALGSAITHVDGGEPPFLLIHGSADNGPDVDAQARALHERLRAAGAASRLLILTGAGHVTVSGLDPAFIAGAPTQETPDAWLGTVDFLVETLGAP